MWSARPSPSDGKVFNEGDVLTLNGTRGLVYAGQLDMVDATENPRFVDFMKLADDVRVLKVRTNAETPDDAATAIEFGAEGIGLFRTEHMFYGTGSEEPLFILRKMIMSGSESAAPRRPRRALPLRQAGHEGDPRDHGRPAGDLPAARSAAARVRAAERGRAAELAEALGVTAEELNRRADELHETEPHDGAPRRPARASPSPRSRRCSSAPSSKRPSSCGRRARVLPRDHGPGDLRQGRAG